MNLRLPKIAISGYGSMGKEVEKIALSQGIEVAEIFDIGNMIDENKTYDFDVAIDFTYPDSVIENVRIYSKLKKNAVIGTTGWSQHFDEVKAMVESSGIGLVYSSNFSIGMQLFNRIVKNAALLLDKIDGYDIMLHEMHHKRKKDSPSGTAISLANIILENYSKKKKINADSIQGTIEPDNLHVSSTRGGEITGIHSIFMDSAADTIELTHRAKNRTGFAIGAIEAAKWVSGKKGFFDFNEVLDNLWKG